LLAVRAALEKLLLDLDFFNRGLTGLMRHGKDVGTVRRPSIFGSQDTTGEQPGGSWRLLEVAHNLFHIGYPDLSQEEIGNVEAATVADLRSGLTAFLHNVAAESQCEVIVLDCHGGPDHLSFAACQASQYSLLVSEPDKITFYGTLHFVRQLEQSTRESGSTTKPDLRLVFNKVVPAFSVNYLTRFYNQNIKQLFGERPLLPIFPIELYLTKEFEKTPFLTEAYPYSLLARKMRLLIFGVLKQRHAEKLPKPIRLMPWPSRFYTRFSMGKVPWLLNVNFIMAVIAIGSVLSYLFTLARDKGLLDSYVAIGSKVEQLELSLQFQHDPKLLPVECKDKKREVQPDCFVAHYEAAIQDWSSYNRYNRYRYDEIPSRQVPEAITSLPHVPVFMANITTGRTEGVMSGVISVERTEHVFERLRSLRESAEVTKNPEQEIRLMGQRIPNPGLMFRVGFFLARFLYDYSGWLLGLAAGWFLSAVLLSWSGELDKRFTYRVRLGSRMLAIFLYLVGVALWTPWLFVSGSAAKSELVVFSLLAVPALIVIINQVWKLFLEMWLERRLLEGSLRLIFVLYIFAAVAFARYSDW
jgi:cellulose biosynthesis protein BcsQ